MQHCWGLGEAFLKLIRPLAAPGCRPPPFWRCGSSVTAPQRSRLGTYGTARNNSGEGRFLARAPTAAERAVRGARPVTQMKPLRTNSWFFELFMDQMSCMRVACGEIPVVQGRSVPFRYVPLPEAHRSPSAPTGQCAVDEFCAPEERRHARSHAYAMATSCGQQTLEGSKFTHHCGDQICPFRRSPACTPCPAAPLRVFAAPRKIASSGGLSSRRAPGGTSKTRHDFTEHDFRAFGLVALLLSD